MKQFNLESQINFEENKCPKHRRYQLNTILVQKNIQNNLICFKCAQERNISNSELFNINEIIDQTEDSTIPNFPPLEDKNIQQFLNEIDSQEGVLGKIVESFNTFFDIFKYEFLQKIQQLQNSTKIKISKLFDLKNEIIDIYNQISSKEIFQKILIENQKDFQDQIKLIIEDKFQNITINTLKIKEKIDEYKLGVDNFNLSESQEIKEVVFNLIEKLDVFKKKNTLKILNDELEKKQQKQIENVKQNINVILDTMKNSKKQSAEEYFSQIKQQFFKYQDLLSEIKYQCGVYNVDIKQAYSSQALKCLEDINTISNHIQSIEKQYLHTNEDKNQQSNQIQFNSKYITDLLSDRYGVNFNYLETLQKKYIKFDSLQRLEVNQINKIDFIKSSYSDSQNQQIIRTGENFINISKSEQKKDALAYTNFILDPKKKYIFRIQITTESDAPPTICLGLIKESMKDNSQVYSNGLSYYEQYYVKGITQIVKGDNVFSGNVRNINKELELRIHLENKTLKIGNFPNYSNISELEDPSLIDLNSDANYRLAVQTFSLKQHVIIKFFSIVDEFDDSM